MATTSPRPRTPLTVAWACRLTRILTWGIEPVRRREILLETDADWDLMHRDCGPVRLTTRALRGVPAAIFSRLDEHEITALPAATIFAIMAVVSTETGLLSGSYPADVRRPTLLAAFGLALGGIALTRSPRRIVLKRLRWPAIALGLGTLGMALNMPTRADWPYDYPFVDTPIGDHLILVGFIAVTVGCFLVALAPALRRRRRVAGIGAAGALAGIFLFGLGQIVWGFAAIPVDLTVTATALVIGLASCSLVHVLPRLRYLEVE
jgi:hypothetical protein